MREPDAGTTLGKCTFCKEIIVEGNGIRSKHATVRGGQWICGDCVLDFKDVVFSAFLDYHAEADREKEDLLNKVKKYGYSVNPETGQLQKL